MSLPGRLAATVILAVYVLCPSPARAQQDARSLVRTVVDSELAADSNDRSQWMFRDANKTSIKSTVTLVVQTGEGDLSKLVEINGQPPTSQQQAADEQKMRRYVTDASVRQKQKQDQKQDSQKASALTKMLPDAFLWTRTGETETETTLAFKPDPKFTPPTYQARVFAAMQGSMVVDRKDRRIKSLKGSLTRDVEFGYGLLGKLQQGGTFAVERQRIGPGVWEITSTHVHIQGHALLFKSIGEQQDEETSGYTPTPPNTTLADAEKMLNDGMVARMVAQRPGTGKPK